MANCPKCGYKLRFIDFKAECPKCGVNLVYYNHQERLTEDADKAEEEYIKFQPKLDRLKFSLAGTKLSIVRLILLFVPIGMLFLPLAHINVNLPFYTIDKDISILNLALDVVAKFDFSTVSLIPGAGVVFYFLSMVGVFLAAIFGIIAIPFVFVSTTDKGIKRNITFPTCGIISMIIAIVSFLVFNASMKDLSAMFTAKLGIGAFLAIIGFLACIAINIIIKKKNVPVKYKDVSEYVERIERRKAELAEMEAKAEEIRKSYAKKETSSK